MSLDKSTLEKVANLARIKVKESEIDPLINELNNIMSWIEKLNEVDIDNIEPMTGVSDAKLRERNDEVNDGGYQDKVVNNSPDSISNSFSVPKVIE